MEPELERLLRRAESLLERLEGVLPARPPRPDWSAPAYRWRRFSGGGALTPVRRPEHVALADLRGIDRQKAELARNTAQFVRGLPANNALLWGARGTGKSSLIKALLGAFEADGLRLIEVDRTDLPDLAHILAAVEDRTERFIVFCDDLSFEADDSGYKALKVALDGSLSSPSDNLLIYATSNRRHLLPEYQHENLEARRVGDEIHPGEAVEEKVALSDRFGLWLSFYAFDQEQYLGIVRHWLSRLGVPIEDEEALRHAALQWALARGIRSGRAAWQFARDWAGRARLDERPVDHW